MTKEARSRFLKLIDHYGIDIYKDPFKFKSLLNDYFKGKYKSERNALIGSISSGVPERLLHNQGSLAYPTLRSHCIDLIQQEGFESKLAQWAVDSWAIAFKIIKKNDAVVTKRHIGITSTQLEGRINNKARSCFLELIDCYGNDIYKDPLRFRFLLNDYFKGQYKSQRNVLVGSISAGVPDFLLSRDGSNSVTKLQSRCINMIQNEGFGPHLAKWAADSWAIAFKIIERSDIEETTGNIDISSTPAGGSVYLDDKLSGKTPCNLSDIPAGIYTLKCTLDGYQDWEDRIEVASGELLDRMIIFTPKHLELPEPNILTPTSSPQPLPTPTGSPPGSSSTAPSSVPSTIFSTKTWDKNTISGVLIFCFLLIGAFYFLSIPQTGTTSMTTSLSPPTPVPIDISSASNSAVGQSISQQRYVDLRSYNNINFDAEKKFAPIYIDVMAYPNIIHDSKWVFDNEHDKIGHAVEIDRPSESSEFTIIVTNKDTGETLLSEHCSNFAASEETRQFVIRYDGPYHIDIQGREVEMDLNIH
jgi:hypothetical protein